MKNKWKIFLCFIFLSTSNFNSFARDLSESKTPTLYFIQDKIKSICTGNEHYTNCIRDAMNLTNLSISVGELKAKCDAAGIESDDCYDARVTVDTIAIYHSDHFK